MLKQLAIYICKARTNSYQIKSVQWLQKVGCLKKRAINLWSLTSWTFFCLRAPCRAKPLMGVLSSPSLFDCSAILNAGKVCASLYTGVSCAECVHVMQSFRLRWTLRRDALRPSPPKCPPYAPCGTRTHARTHTRTRTHTDALLQDSSHPPTHLPLASWADW